MKCAICKNEIDRLEDPDTGKMVSDKGYSAHPVKNGRCCSKCNEKVVLPVRKRLKDEFPFKVKKRADERVCFICPDCGPFVRVIVEQWSDGSDGPNRLTLIQHYNKKAIVFDTIRVGSKRKKKQHLYNFCAECGLLIPPPISKERIKRFPIFKPKRKENRNES